MGEHPPEPNPPTFREVFSRTTYGDRNLFACSQAGLVNNLNDGTSWGVFLLLFANFGLGVERIGILKAVYLAVWGTLPRRLATRSSQPPVGCLSYLRGGRGA